MERHDEAFADFDRAIKLNPAGIWTRLFRGLAYLQMERYDEALADLNRALELDPDHDFALQLRGTNPANRTFLRRPCGPRPFH